MSHTPSVNRDKQNVVFSFPEHSDLQAGTAFPDNLRQLSSLANLKEMKAFCDRRFELIDTASGRAHYRLPENVGELRLASSRHGIALNRREVSLAHELTHMPETLLLAEYDLKYLWCVCDQFLEVSMDELQSALGVNQPTLQAYLDQVGISRSMGCTKPEPIVTSSLSRTVCELVERFDQIPVSAWADPALFGKECNTGKVKVRGDALAKLVTWAPALNPINGPASCM